jgi:anti-sigma factor RsiW
VNCSACEARLAAYLDGEAPPSEARAFEQHLAGCTACRMLADDLRALEARLNALPQIAPRADMTVAVMAAIATMPAPKPARLQARFIVGYLAAAWALLFALTMTHVLDWPRLAAGVAVQFGKLGAAGAALGDVAAHLHVPILAAGALGVELLVLLVGALALRRFLPQLSGWLAGAQAI